MEEMEEIDYTELLLKSVDRDKVIALVEYITNKNTEGDTVEEYFENLNTATSSVSLLSCSADDLFDDLQNKEICEYAECFSLPSESLKIEFIRPLKNGDDAYSQTSFIDEPVELEAA